MIKKTLVLERIPPGDNWKDVDNEEKTFTSLTLALGYSFKKTKIKEFYISAAEGKVWTMEDVNEVSKPEIDDLYGD